MRTVQSRLPPVPGVVSRRVVHDQVKLSTRDAVAEAGSGNSGPSRVLIPASGIKPSTTCVPSTNSVIPGTSRAGGAVQDNLPEGRRNSLVANVENEVRRADHPIDSNRARRRSLRHCATWAAR